MSCLVEIIKAMKLTDSFYRKRKLEQLVENQTSYTLQHAAMHVFETHQAADQVLLKFSQPVLASMLMGKKVMHLDGLESFDFFKGESLLLPSDELMCIDFPEASQNNPTKCLALAICEYKIEKIVQLMNETMTLSDGNEWQKLDYNFHFTNSPDIYQILQRLIYLFTENHSHKDFFVDNMLQELIIRILQGNQRKMNDNGALQNSSNRLGYVIDYIKNNFSKKISSKVLSDKACMSESNFFRVFKNEMGVTPVEYINQIRIKKASEMLAEPNTSITDTYLSCGFENRSYFNRQFKRFKGSSPLQYKKRFAK